MDILGAFFAAIVSTYLVYGGRLEAGYAGFALNMVLAFTRQILGLVTFYNMLEIQCKQIVFIPKEYHAYDCLFSQ